MSNHDVQCWCCQGPLGQCQCQDDATILCTGCYRCDKHCTCHKVERNGHTKTLLPELSPQAPTITNAAGGQQSASPYRCDLLPPLACLEVAKVVAAGAQKY